MELVDLRHLGDLRRIVAVVRQRVVRIGDARLGEISAIAGFARQLEGANARDVTLHREDLENEFVRTSREGFKLAHDISAYSLVALTRAALPLMEKSGGGSVLALTYLGAERAVEGYNVMGVAKASLEASVRYLAANLGPKNVRINAISAGPVNTLAARGIKGFNEMLRHHAEKAPLRRNVELEEIGNAGLLLYHLVRFREDRGYCSENGLMFINKALLSSWGSQPANLVISIAPLAPKPEEPTSSGQKALSKSASRLFQLRMLRVQHSQLSTRRLRKLPCRHWP